MRRNMVVGQAFPSCHGGEKQHASRVFTCDSVSDCSRLAVRSAVLGAKDCECGLSKLRRSIQKHWPVSTVWHDPQGRSRNGTIHFYRHLHRIKKVTISIDY